MKHLQITAHVDSEQAPAFFNQLANSPDIEEARVLDLTTTVEGVDNLLFAIDGDPTSFADKATDTPGIESVELSSPTPEQTFALVVMRPLETPLFDAIHRASTHAGLVVRTPIIYRDGNMYATAVGDSETLQVALEDVPNAMDIQVDEIGRFRGKFDEPGTTLSDGQRKALSVALDMGYYEQPRGATHEDVAEELGCAPPTASNHLQKAEAKLIRTVMDEFGPSI